MYIKSITLPIEMEIVTKRESLYPSLSEMKEASKASKASAPSVDDVEEFENEQNFRLSKINEVHQFLESEKEKREEISKKYRKLVKALDYTNGTLVGITTLGGATGAVLLATVITVPVAVVLESITVVTGGLSCLSTVLQRRFLKKIQKHEKLAVLACSKLNSISNHVSKALDDDNVSHEEFKLIMDELEKYKTLKRQIRSKSYKDISEEEKRGFIEKGREEATEAFLNTINKSKVKKVPRTFVKSTTIH